VIQRYTRYDHTQPFQVETEHRGMAEFPEGYWVKHEDHLTEVAKLQARIEFLEKVAGQAVKYGEIELSEVKK